MLAESIVDFYPHNMDKSDTHPFLTKMSVALNEVGDCRGFAASLCLLCRRFAHRATLLPQMYNPSGSFPSNDVHPGWSFAPTTLLLIWACAGTYLQWNINLKDWRHLREDFEVPYVFARDEALLVSHFLELSRCLRVALL